MSEEITFVNGRYQVKPKSGPPPLPSQLPTPRSNRGSLVLAGGVNSSGGGSGLGSGSSSNIGIGGIGGVVVGNPSGNSSGSVSNSGIGGMGGGISGIGTFSIGGIGGIGGMGAGNSGIGGMGGGISGIGSISIGGIGGIGGGSGSSSGLGIGIGGINNNNAGNTIMTPRDFYKATSSNPSIAIPPNIMSSPLSPNKVESPVSMEQAFQGLTSSSSLRARDTRRMALGQADIDWKTSDNPKTASSTLRLRNSGTLMLNDLSSLTGSAEPEPETGAITDRVHRQRGSWVRGSVEGAITPREAPTSPNSVSTPRGEKSSGRKSNSNFQPPSKAEETKPLKSPENAKKTEQEKEYTNYLEKAKKENFDALEALRMVYHSGYDNYLRPIIVIVASLIPAKTVDLEKLLLFFIKILDPVVNQEYVLIYVHTNSGTENIPKFAFLRKCYGIFSRKYKKNLKALYIVQPTSLVKGIAKLFKPFLSNKFWKKLFYINEIKELYQYMNPQQVQFPIELLPSNSSAKPEIFGVTLEEVMKHPMNMYSPVPLIVLNCMKYLLKNGTHVEGIFRLSGRAQRIDELQAAYDRGEVVDFSSEPDVHVIAGLLKLYFRKLPDPLCCYSLYREWIHSYDSTNMEKTVHNIKIILKKLPRTHYMTLNSLLGLLSLLKDSSETTRMTAANLAICWAPNILRPQEESLSTALVESNVVNNIIALLITEFNLFFPIAGAEDMYLQQTSPKAKADGENNSKSITQSPPISHHQRRNSYEPPTSPLFPETSAVSRKI